MKRAEIEAVREASRREREHSSRCRIRKGGVRDVCICLVCDTDRVTIARAMPAILALLDDLVPQPGGR